MQEKVLQGIVRIRCGQADAWHCRHRRARLHTLTKMNGRLYSLAP